MSRHTDISDVYAEIRYILGLDAAGFDIEAIADAAYVFDSDTQTFESVDNGEFWSIVETKALL